MSMIRKSMPSGHDTMGGNRFSLATYAAAEAAEKEAGALRNQWTTTEAALTAAKKAAEAGQFDQAVASSKEAEALAKASIFQATSEKQRWKDLEIR